MTEKPQGGNAEETETTASRRKYRQRQRAAYFLGVGGFCFLLTLAVNYGLKFTVLGGHPTSAFLLANAVATIVSYYLSRRYTFGDVMHGLKRIQFLKFVIMSVIAVGITSAPVYISRWIFGFTEPQVSFVMQEVADFIAGPMLGTLFGMIFRWWAMKKFVFVDTMHRRTEIL